MDVRTGLITLVQEGRFRLEGDDGRSTLLILSHKAAVEPQDLPALQRGAVRVAVRCSPAPGRIAQVAHAIQILDQHARG